MHPRYQRTQVIELMTAMKCTKTRDAVIYTFSYVILKKRDAANSYSLPPIGSQIQRRTATTITITRLQEANPVMQHYND